MSNPQSFSLGERRELRYLCNLSVLLQPSRFLSQPIKAKIENINRNGIGLTTFRLPKVNAKANITIVLSNSEKFKSVGVCVWVYKDTDANLFRSGWRFIKNASSIKDPIANIRGSSLEGGNILADRRASFRRSKTETFSSNNRKSSRRLRDCIDEFNLLEPCQDYQWRRKSDDRRSDNRRRDASNHLGPNKRGDERRARMRRSLRPSHDVGGSAIVRSIKKIADGFRDYLIFWLPAPVVRRATKGKTFAFITHPRTVDDVALQYPFAKYIPNAVMNIWLKWQWPVIGTEIRGIRKKDGEYTQGWLIFCPLTAKQMIRDRDLARKKVLQTARFAQKVGAKIIGLGAFTSIVTHDGVDIEENVDIGVTSGNALSAAVAVQNAVTAAALSNKSVQSITVAIVGAAGNVGSACARNFYGHVQKLILVDINRRALNAMCASLQGHSTEVIASSSIESISEADIVITVTNAPGAIVRASHLKKGAIAIDCAQPKNVSENVPKERPDVIVIESAILSVPDIECKFDLGIGPKEALGCMAETVVLDAIGWHKNYSIGQLTKKQTNDIMAAARILGINLAHFRNSQGYVTETSIEQLKLNDR